MDDQTKARLGARSLAAQGRCRPDSVTKAIVPPIHMSATYLRDADNGYSSGHVYGRSDNPSLQQAEDFIAARDAGAVFGVSPGLTAELISAARSSGLPLLPGVMTPSEVMVARAAGFLQLKLFPAVPAGGVGMLNAIAGPLPDVTFCPTGGISVETAPAFLACDNVACVGGSWLTPKDAIRAGDWARITALATAASALRKVH